MMGAVTLLYTLAPRGDLREMWAQTLAIGAWDYGRRREGGREGGRGGGRARVGLREGDGVGAMEKLALMEAVVLNRAGTLTEAVPTFHSLSVMLGQGGSRAWGGQVGGLEGLKALMRPRWQTRRRMSPSSQVEGKGRKEGGKEGEDDSEAEEEEDRNRLLELLQGWLMTSSLGDDAMRKEQHHRRNRRLDRRKRGGGGGGGGGGGDCYSHLPTTRESMVHILGDMLNLDKEWEGLHPFDQALFSALASSSPASLPPSSPPLTSPSSAFSPVFHHEPPPPTPALSLQPPCHTTSLPTSTSTTASTFSDNADPGHVQLTPPSAPPARNPSLPPRPTDLPPAIVSMILGKIRGEARLVSYAPFDPQAGFEARTFAWKEDGREGEGEGGGGGGGGKVVYKTFFRATPEALLARCEEVGGEGGSNEDMKKEGDLQNRRSSSSSSSSSRRCLTPALRHDLYQALAELASQDGCTLVGVAVKEEDDTYEERLGRAREEQLLAPSPPPPDMPLPAGEKKGKEGQKGESKEETEDEEGKEEGGQKGESKEETEDEEGKEEGGQPQLARTGSWDYYPAVPPSLRGGGGREVSGRGGRGVGDERREMSVIGGGGASLVRARPERLKGARLLGMCAFVHPLVEGVKEAVQGLKGSEGEREGRRRRRRRGRRRRVVLVTGEGKEAAETLGRKVGLVEEREGGREGGREVVCAPEVQGPLLSLILHEEAKVSVICRASGQDRVQVVQALEDGEREGREGGREGGRRVVGVTGNFAAAVPALEWPSSLGVVLEGRGIYRQTPGRQGTGIMREIATAMATSSRDDSMEEEEGGERRGGRAAGSCQPAGQEESNKTLQSFHAVTDVARRAADLVLLEGDLSSFSSAAATARRLLHNAQVAAVHTLACHFSLALLWLPLLWLAQRREGGREEGGVSNLPLAPVQVLVLEAYRMAGARAALAGGQEVEEEEEEKEEDERGVGISGNAANYLSCEGTSSAVSFPSFSSFSSSSSSSSLSSSSAAAGRHFLSASHLSLAFTGILSIITAVILPLLYNEMILPPSQEADSFPSPSLRRQTLVFASLLLTHPLLALHLHNPFRPSSFSLGCPDETGMQGKLLWPPSLVWLLVVCLFLWLVASDRHIQAVFGFVPLGRELWGAVGLSAVGGTMVWMEVGKCGIWCVGRQRRVRWGGGRERGSAGGRRKRGYGTMRGRGSGEGEEGERGRGSVNLDGGGGSRIETRDLEEQAPLLVGR